MPARCGMRPRIRPATGLSHPVGDARVRRVRHRLRQVLAAAAIVACLTGARPALAREPVEVPPCDPTEFVDAASARCDEVQSAVLDLGLEEAGGCDLRRMRFRLRGDQLHLRGVTVPCEHYGGRRLRVRLRGDAACRTFDGVGIVAGRRFPMRLVAVEAFEEACDAQDDADDTGDADDDPTAPPDDDSGGGVGDGDPDDGSDPDEPEDEDEEEEEEGGEDGSDVEPAAPPAVLPAPHGGTP